MTTEDPKSKLQVDADWKAEAQAEKERLAKQEQAAAPADRPRPGELPEADFRTLIGVLASQAMLGLGLVGNPQEGKVVVDLVGAQFSIDLLAVLEERTRGNLTDDESKELTQVIAELRARYVQITQLIAQQSAAGGPAAPGAAESGKGGEAGAGPIVSP